MRQFAMLMILLLLAISIGTAQDNAAAEETAAEQPDVLVDSAADNASPASPLEELDWMVGEWIDQGQDSTIITKCSWTKNRKFLKRSFKVKIDEEVTLEGDQFVGWDPIAGQMRSWTFDSEGGVGEGRWIQHGNRWLVKASFVLADGARASSLNVYTYVDADTIRWRSTNREIAGELQPNIPEVTVVRRKPDHAQQNANEGVRELSDGNPLPSCEVQRSSRVRHSSLASRPRRYGRISR